MHRSTIQISEARSMNAQCMFNGLGDGNEHVKRAKGLISKTTTSTFAVTGRLQRENAWFHVWRRKLSSDDEIFFLFLKSDMTLKKSTQGRIGLHFTTSASSNNRDEDWNNAKSLSKWHSCCRRRRGKLPIKNGPETHIPFTRVRDKFLNGRIFYLCRSFTRNRANSVWLCSTVYKSPYKNFPGSPGPVKTKNAGCVQVFVRSKICPEPRVNLANSWWWLLVTLEKKLIFHMLVFEFWFAWTQRIQMFTRSLLLLISLLPDLTCIFSLFFHLSLYWIYM